MIEKRRSIHACNVDFLRVDLMRATREIQLYLDMLYQHPKEAHVKLAQTNEAYGVKVVLWLLTWYPMAFGVLYGKTLFFPLHGERRHRIERKLNWLGETIEKQYHLKKQLKQAERLLEFSRRCSGEKQRGQH